MSQHLHILITRLVALLFLALLTACAGVQLISSYDETTDKALTAIQQSTDDFIVKLAKNAPSDQNAFSKHEAIYDDLDQQIRRLEFRVNSIPKNQHMVNLVADVRAVVLGENRCSADGASLRDLHCMPASKEKGPSKTALMLSQRNINQAIGAALALELAKKQGTDTGK